MELKNGFFGDAVFCLLEALNRQECHISGACSMTLSYARVLFA